MVEETLHHRGNTLVRRLILAPGEATRWHKDPFHRVSVIFRGEALLIEFRDGRASVRVAVTPGQVDWDEPGERVHRAVNITGVPYEEVTIFFSRTRTTFRSQTRTDRRGVKCQLDRVADVPPRACRKVANRGISNDGFGPEWIVGHSEKARSRFPMKC